MPLVSIYDPAPHRPPAGPARGLSGYVASVVYIEELSTRLLAQAFAPTELEATELGERIGWGFWRSGLSGAAEPELQWGKTERSLLVHPFAPGGSEVLFRESSFPMGFVFVVGEAGAKGLASASYGAAAADLGLLTGPARWDHRTQYTTARRVPFGSGWSTRDAIDETGDLPKMRQRRKGPHVVDVLHTLLDDSP